MLFELASASLPLFIALTALILIKAQRAAATPAPMRHQPLPMQPLPPIQAQVPSPPLATEATVAASSSSSAMAFSSSDTPAAAVADGEIATKSPSPARPVPANAIQLRFLLGEHPLLTHLCDAAAPIHALKLEVYQHLLASSASASASASSASASASAPPPRILLIFQGVLLRDDKCLRDYPAIAPDTIVHVHAIPQQIQQQHQQQQQQIHLSAHAHAQQQAQMRHRGAGGAAAAAAGGIPQYLIAPGHLALGPAAHAALVVHPAVPAPLTLARALFALFVSSLGVLWGLVIVFGGQLFSLHALLCLIVLTGVMVVGIVQAIET